MPKAARNEATLAGLAARAPARPWAEGGKIPWDDADFSTRMLREHLSQQHDRASRRFERIDRHVQWLHESVLAGRPGRILDLGCGPGFYTTRLARLGHSCIGVDFSPASIAHARSEAEREGLHCEYRQQDLLGRDFDTGQDAALLSFGEFNTFRSPDARTLLARAHRALLPGAPLVLEVHDQDFVRMMGESAPSWFTAERSVFADEPHLCLRECAWHPDARAATERHYVLLLRTRELATYMSTTQAYSDAEYLELLRDAGFSEVERYASLSGDAAHEQHGLFVWVARCGGPER